ncbi:MAG: hypothetical protein K6E36_02770 [Oscillospiraceae bacterium]|nr:hypothetical protein [Oscillospiraceae bacterium]
MKQIRRGASLLLAGAMLTSVPVIPYAAPEITAEAVSQTRVFRYDFGSFAALFDTQTGKWYTESGAVLKPQTEAVQTWKNGGLTVDFEQHEAYRESEDGTRKLNDRVTDFLRNSLAYFVPDYATEYYDKAQQKHISVPAPTSFPLTYRVLPDAECFSVEILIGEYSLGQFTDSETQYQPNGAVGYGRPDAFTDDGDLTVDGNISIADAIYSSRIAAEDKELKISALGLDLADEDGDGMVGMGDVRALLKELVSPNTRPYLTQVSEIYRHETLRDLYTAEELSVFLEDGSETYVTAYESLNGSLEQTAKYHGYDSFEQMLSSFEGDGKTSHFLADCEPGETYDKWYLSYIDSETVYKYMEIKSLDVSEAGLLTVSWYGLAAGEQTQQFNAFTHILTVKHGVWDEIKGFHCGNDSCTSQYASGQEDRFSAEVGKLLTITRSRSGQRIPADAIPVTQDIRETVMIDDRFAEPAFGYDYDSWDGKDDYERSLALTDEDMGVQMSVLPKDDEIRIFTKHDSPYMPQDCRVTWFKLDDEGKLTVGILADRRNDRPIGESVVFADDLLLPEGSLSADAVKSVELRADIANSDLNEILANYYFKEPWDASMGYYPVKLALLKDGSTTTGTRELTSEIISNEHLRDQFAYAFETATSYNPSPDDSAPGTKSMTSRSSLSCRNGMIEQIAKQHGYADAAQLAWEGLYPYDTDRHFLTDCQKGSEYDRWYLSCIFDEEAYQDCRITGLNLSEDGLLTVTWAMLSNEKAEDTAFSHILTVEHGIWDKVKAFDFKTVLYDAADAEQLAAFRRAAGQALTIGHRAPDEEPPTYIDGVQILLEEYSSVKADWDKRSDEDWTYEWTKSSSAFIRQEDYEAAEQTLVSPSDGFCHISAALKRGEKSDTLMLYCTAEAPFDGAFGIRSLQMDKDGKLTVSVAFCTTGDRPVPVIHGRRLTLPAGQLPDITALEVQHTSYNDPGALQDESNGDYLRFKSAVSKYNGIAVTRIGTEQPRLSDFTYPVTEHKVLCDQYTVQRMTDSYTDETGNVTVKTMMTYNTLNGNLEEIAKIHGYENGLELLQAVEQIPRTDSGAHFLLHCEEGEQFDKWYLSFFFDSECYNRCEFSDLRLTIGRGMLDMKLSLLNDRNGAGLFYNAFTHILTVEHGLWNKVKGYWIDAKTYSGENAKAFSESYSDKLTLIYTASEEAHASIRISTAIINVSGLEHEQEKLQYDGTLTDWEGRDDFLEASRTLSTAWDCDLPNGTTDRRAELCALVKDGKLKLYITGSSEEVSWSSYCGIEELYLGPDGKLTVTAGFYPAGDVQTPVIFAETIELPQRYASDRILSVELIPHIYRDPRDNSSGSAVIRGEQWEAFQAATETVSFTRETAA